MGGERMSAERETILMILDALWNEKPIRWFFAKFLDFRILDGRAFHT